MCHTVGIKEKKRKNEAGSDLERGRVESKKRNLCSHLASKSNIKEHEEKKNCPH